MSELVHCIYSSVEAKPFQPEDIEALLTHSQDNNRRHNITGILLHVGCTFFQVLEGPRQAVDALYSRILVDDRHTGITRIIYEPIPRRYFGEFTMSLAALSTTDLAAAIEDQDLALVEDRMVSLDEGRAKRLLRAFSQGRWRARLQPRGTGRQTLA